MKKKISKLETVRQNGKTQVDAQRSKILEAAETLFLQQGLECTNMTDIAAQAGITRMSLYRYYPDRDQIAFEIAAGMLKKIEGSYDMGGRAITFETLREIALAMIDKFYLLRDAYRYLGMFDHLYGDRYPSETLAAWYKDQIFSLRWGGSLPEASHQDASIRKQAVTILNTVMSFLEKMAARGELMSNEQEVPLDEQLNLFKEMIGCYIDRLVTTKT
jgi:AcrR family transcriptional regulator